MEEVMRTTSGARRTDKPIRIHLREIVLGTYLMGCCITDYPVNPDERTLEGRGLWISRGPGLSGLNFNNERELRTLALKSSSVSCPSPISLRWVDRLSLIELIHC
jgi:hypothetical protein